jgi:predicted RNA binding protein YcfA (HicA-like mRNA interferase family)
MSIAEAIKELEGNETNIRFSRLLKICEEFFGKCRTKGSHHIFKMPWAGNPRINLQKDGDKAKIYQVEQVILCLKKWAKENLEHGVKK